MSKNTPPQIGQQAPDFETRTHEGTPVKLSDYRGRKVILYFYPKDDTPGCTTQACGFRDNYEKITANNAMVLGISPDDEASHQHFRRKFDLPFILLTDDGHKIAEQYGLWSRQPWGTMGVTRSHFVIDEQGVIIDAQVKIKADDSVRKALERIQ